MADLVKAVVAAGHTVETGKHSFGPGKEVALPAAEVEQLRTLGFLVDPAVKEIARANGPSFTPSGGPSISVAA